MPFGSYTRDTTKISFNRDRGRRLRCLVVSSVYQLYHAKQLNNASGYNCNTYPGLSRYVCQIIITSSGGRLLSTNWLRDTYFTALHHRSNLRSFMSLLPNYCVSKLLAVLRLMPQTKPICVLVPFELTRLVTGHLRLPRPSLLSLGKDGEDLGDP